MNKLHCSASLLAAGLLTTTLSTALTLAPSVVFAAVSSTAQAQTESNLAALLDRGAYWYTRFRFDLATQAFNKVLMVDPSQPEAMKWKGLIDLNSGNIRAAQVWLDQLEKTSGVAHPQTVELQQTMDMLTRKRQRLAEIEFLAQRESPPEEWLPGLNDVFDQQPLGEPAMMYYQLLASSGEANKEKARRAVSELISRFPRDKRYTKLLSDLGGAPDPNAIGGELAQAAPVRSTPAPTPKRAEPSRKPTKKPRSNPERASVATRGKTTVAATESTTEVATEPALPTLSDFELGSQLANNAQTLIEQNNTFEATQKLQEAVDLNPDYAWFRYDLASLLADQNSDNTQAQARQVMADGRVFAPKDPDMLFASALIESRLGDDQQALDLLARVPDEQWTSGMRAMDQRLRYGLYMDRLLTLREQGRYNEMPDVMAQNRRFNAEPRARELVQELRNRAAPTASMSYNSNKIEGTPGISQIDADEVALELALPLDFESELFLRADHIQALSGDYRLLEDAGDLVDFGTTRASFTRADLQGFRANSITLPANFEPLPDENFSGHLLGIGWRNDNYRIDIGKPVGNFPVDSWVGGIRWSTDIGPSTVRIDVARRIVGGSVLSSVGAIDPITKTTWGGARRNGITALVYSPLPLDSAFVGIGRLNYITGQSLPTNREINLQLIYSKALYRDNTQTVEAGVSGFFWRFQRNMRLYTFGQGGYYSPQSFRSFSFPITWTGAKNDWSWRFQAVAGESRSKEDPSELFPGRPDLAQAADALGNPTIDEGGFGGGDSFGFSLALEHRLTSHLAFGLSAAIDRSEGYNPDTLAMYLRYSFGGKVNLNVPPEPVVPYSQF